MKTNKIKEEFNLSKSRELVKQILQGVYTGSENHRIIELIFANVETQDKEFIRNEDKLLELYQTKQISFEEFIFKRSELLGEKLK